MINHWAFLIMMTYFNDLEFLDGQIVPQCRVSLTDHVAASYSLEFIRSGRLALRRGHGSAVVLDRPAVFWHRPGGHYDYGACDGAGWFHHWLTFRGDRAQRILEKGLDPLSPSGYVFVEDPVEVGRLFERLTGLIHQRSLASHARAVGQMEELLAVLAENRSHPEADEAFRQGVKGLCRSIQAQPQVPVDFEAEAQRMNLSYSHFRRRFKQFVGRSPHDYLLTARMYRAAQLISLRWPIKEVAAAAGYEDPGQFSRMFRRLMGMSPQRYRDGMPGYESK